VSPGEEGPAGTGPRGSSPASEERGAPLRLSEEEADLVAAEALAAARVLGGDPGEQAARLAAAARDGEVPADLAGLLGELVLASLAGGRARRLYLAEGERVLTRLFERTPVGARLKADLDALNAALGALKGRRLEEVRVGLRTPGHLTVTLRTEGFDLTLSLRPDGVGLESLSA
jgi:hypothetical protein